MAEIAIAAVAASAGVIQALSASDAIKKGLHSVKISKPDASRLENKLHGELFETWNESHDFTMSRKIPKENIDGFLDHLQNAYKGIDDNKRNEMSKIMSDKSWFHNIMEWNFYQPDNSGAEYGIVCFGRSPDGKSLDCLVVQLKIKFTISSKIKEPTNKGSCLSERIPGLISKKDLQNFFRLKALEGCLSEGYVEKINFVNSLKEITSLQALEGIPNSSQHLQTVKAIPRSSKGSSEQASEDNPNSSKNTREMTDTISVSEMSHEDTSTSSTNLHRKVKETTSDSQEGSPKKISKNSSPEDSSKNSAEDISNSSTGLSKQDSDATCNSSEDLQEKPHEDNHDASAELSQQDREATNNSSEDTLEKSKEDNHDASAGLSKQDIKATSNSTENSTENSHEDKYDASTELSKEERKASTTSPEGLHEDVQKKATHLTEGSPKKAAVSISKSPADLSKQSQEPTSNPSKDSPSSKMAPKATTTTGETKDFIKKTTEEISHSSVESNKQTSKVNPNSCKNSPKETSENSRSSNESTIVTQEAISKSSERLAEKDVNENGNTDESCEQAHGTNPLPSEDSLNGEK